MHLYKIYHYACADFKASNWREMQSETPVSSPDVECYEECVVAEEDIYHPSANATLSDCISPIPRVNKDSGRVTKKSNILTSNAELM